MTQPSILSARRAPARHCLCNSEHASTRSRLSLLLPLIAVALLFGAGCGSDKETHGDSHSHAAQSRSSAASPFVVPESGKISIDADDNMRYSLRNFVVRPGQQIELTFNHTGRMPLGAMGHNIAILKPGTNLEAFVRAAAYSAKTEYIPPSMSDQVLAHTKMLGGGQSDTITFTAPTEPGEYDFLCSFPAHLIAGMKGKMIVSKE